MTETTDEIVRLGGDAGYEGREGLENLLTNIEEGASEARNEEGEELRASLLSIAAWAVCLMERVDKNLPADAPPFDEDGDDMVSEGPSRG